MERGFTIIEVMLFFAISGLLFAMLMIGANQGIVQQRYLDSVRSYKAFLQNQYAEVLNTQNDRSNNLKCDASGVSAGATTPGADTNCVILGRVIKIKDDGKTLWATNVTGYVGGGAQGDNLAVYSPKAVDDQAETWEMDWGSQLKDKDGNELDIVVGTAVEPVILIIRSPVSGLVKVFTASSDVGLDNMVAANGSYGSDTLIHYMDGESGNLPKQCISINPKIASADGVSTVDAVGTRCS